MDRDVEFLKTVFAKSVFSIYPGLQNPLLTWTQDLQWVYLVNHQVTQCSIEVPIAQSELQRILQIDGDGTIHRTITLTKMLQLHFAEGHEDMRLNSLAVGDVSFPFRKNKENLIFQQDRFPTNLKHSIHSTQFSSFESIL